MEKNKSNTYILLQCYENDKRNFTSTFTKEETMTVEKPRRYFITKRRLANPAFHKTVRMMLTLNNQVDIHMPQEALDFFLRNWKTLSIGNTILCIDVGKANIPYDLDHDVATALPFYKEVLRVGPKLNEIAYGKRGREGLIRKALGSIHALPVDIDYYINNKYSENYSEILAICNNKKTELYQIEMMNVVTVEKESLYGAFVADQWIRRIPNYMLKEMLDWAFSSAGYSADTKAKTWKEAFRRGFVVTAEPTIIVKSQLKTMEISNGESKEKEKEKENIVN